MKNVVRKLLALIVIISFSTAQIALAQSDATDTSAAPGTAASDTGIALAAPSADSSASSTDAGAATAPAPIALAAPVDPQDQGGATLQGTFNGQSTITADTLENTTDPQSANSSVSAGSEVPLVDASSSDATSTDPSSVLAITDATGTPAVAPIASTSTADIVAADIAVDTPDIPDQTATDTPQDQTQILPPVRVSIPLAALTPAAQYAFTLSGASIPAVTDVQHSDGTVTKVTASTVVTPVVNNTDGTFTIGGACSEAYYVVLLFKNATDYAESPSSYIVNRAYPCVGGTFTYSVSQLPYALPDGNYYLMVGQEGTSGSWTPETALTEITINKKLQ